MDSTIRVADLPALRGARWIGESFRLFGGAPLVWISLCLSWIGISFALIFVPIIGAPIASFLQPAFAASFAIIAYRQSHGERISMGELFIGFRHNLRSLVNLGAVVAMTMLAILFITVMLGLPIGPTAPDQAAVEEYANQIANKSWVLLVAFGLIVLVKGALWFAPQLIAFHGMDTIQSIRWSVYAAVSNLGALVVYGVLLFGLFFVCSLTYPWAIGLVVAFPVMAISTYVGYRDVFEEPKLEVTEP
jgi:hypothetical protein